MILRPYQHRCLEKIRDDFERLDSTLAVLATGLGKTVIFSELARRWDRGRVLIVAHRDELIQQAADKLHKATGERPAIEMGESWSDEDGFLRPAKVVVTSVQTMCRPKRCQRFRPADFGLVVIDEAHHAIAESYRKVIAHFRQNNELKVLGVTATPRRSDDLALGQVFEGCAFEFGINDAIREGWLVPIRQKIVQVEDLDFSQVKTVAGDFHQGELEAILSQEGILHRMAAPLVELAGDQPTLVFCVGVAQARLLAALLNRYKPHSAESVNGETPKPRRKEIVDDFRSGKLQFLCNVGVFLEGFDAPETSVLAMCRPTQSLVVYLQALGRITRTRPGVVDGVNDAAERVRRISLDRKPCGLVLDYVGNSEKHNNKLVTSADALGGQYALPVRQYAARVANEEGSAIPTEEALERADAELALLAEEEERRRAIKAKAQFTLRDPGGSHWSYDPGDGAEPDTNKQIWKLRSLGFSTDRAAAMSKKQASRVIAKILEKQAVGAA